MDLIKQFIRTHQQGLALVIGYALVATLGFGLGRFSATSSIRSTVPLVHVEQSSSVPLNYNPNEPAVQSASTIKSAPNASESLNCTGKIKGSSSMIYHLPGRAFYNKTTHPIRCFTTEAEAKAAGFRKAAR